ncbi:hypothetical protein [Acetobacter malorum]|uniref:hypothetical protein n=1 Tax=Acetobacter malorum TaxID=178901 RepID=UPI000A6E973A|nr:hypothetical protein [Acetobacter malorum]
MRAQKSEFFEREIKIFVISISYIDIFSGGDVPAMVAGFGPCQQNAYFSLYDSDSHLHDKEGLVIAGLIIPAGKAVVRPFSARFPA